MSSSGTVRRRHAEAGFVLATTLLVTTLLTVMLAASFILVSAEQRTTDNSLGTARALVLAQAGLQNYFTQNRGLDSTSVYDSTRVFGSGGYADVVAQLVRPASSGSGTSLSLWVVRSRGVSTSATMAGQVRGTRTIAQFAQLNPGILPARASMVAANGVQMVGGGNNPINGMDHCGTQDTIGLTVSANPYGYNPGSGGGASAPAGRPRGIESFGTPATVVDSTGIDWPSLVHGNFTPTYTLPAGSSWNPAGTQMSAMGYVPGNLTLLSGATGQGILVVAGDLTMSNNSAWRGVVLVGGRLIEQPGNPSFRLSGMITTGLNISLDSTVLPNFLSRRGNASIDWASCYVGRAIAAQTFMVPIKNSWADTWSTY